MSKVQLNYLRLYLGYLMTAAQLSLRDQEQIVSRLRVVLQTIPQYENIHAVTLSIFLFLRHSDPSMYKALLSGNCTLNDCLDYINNLPNEEESIKEFTAQGRRENIHNIKYCIEAMFIGGLDELSASNPGKKTNYLEQLDSESNPGRIEIIKNALSKSGAGFKETETRLNLTSNFVSN
jgi:hypothetical protein